MDVKIRHCWKDILNDEFAKDYFIRLVNFVKKNIGQLRFTRLGNSYSMPLTIVASMM
jgi:uracil DNA glycosylase